METKIKMGTIKENLNRLIVLQNKDITLDNLRCQNELIPLQIEEKNNTINDQNLHIQEIKKNITQLQLKRKDKEIELETKENEIRKHNTELNAIKTNEAYRALLNQINQLKESKQLLEDEILTAMDKIEQESNIMKEKEKEYKQLEIEMKANISSLENEMKINQQEILRLETDRIEYVKQIDNKFYQTYEHIRSGREGLAIVPIIGENCGGCSIALRPQIINEVIKEQELVFCDNCSRILYKNES